MFGLSRLIARLSGSSGFQRFAFGFPLTRGVARARAGALFDILGGFIHTQVLAACVELDLFRWTAERPRRTDEVAGRAGLSTDAAQRLLDAATALGLLSRTFGRYAPGPIGAPLAGEAGAGVRAMIAHHGALYRDLADPLAMLRAPRGGGELAAFWPYARTANPARLPAGDVSPYTALMSASQDFIAGDVLDALGEIEGPWLDLGGGDGAFLAEAARRQPRLRGLVYDLPPVAALAADRFARLALCDRIAAEGGDFRQAPPAGRFAVVSLVRILHDHDDAQALDILRVARRALAPGGRLVVAEPMRGRAADARITDAYFGLYLYAMGQGRMRTPAEIRALARTAGLPRLRPRAVRRPFLTRLLVAQA